MAILTARKARVVLMAHRRPSVLALLALLVDRGLRYGSEGWGFGIPPSALDGLNRRNEHSLLRAGERRNEAGGVGSIWRCVAARARSRCQTSAVRLTIERHPFTATS